MIRGVAARCDVARCASLVALPVSAQDAPSRDVAPARVPFGVGERLEYDMKFGKLHVGTSGDAWKSCRWTPCAATTRGTRVFNLRGGIPFYRVNDRYEAWFDAHTLASLRYWQDIDEGSYEPKRHYEIFPDRREYIENDKTAAAERRASARRRLVPRTSCARSRCASGMDTTLQRLLQGRSAIPVRIQGPARATRSTCRPASSPRSSSSRSFKSKALLRGRPRRGLAFRRREPHHAADEVEGQLRIPQPLPQIVPPVSDDERRR